MSNDFAIGDTLFLQSKTEGNAEAIIVDIFDEGKTEGRRIKHIRTWYQEQSESLMLKKNVRKKAGLNSLSIGINVKQKRYLIVVRDFEEQVLPHMVMEKEGWLEYYIVSKRRYRVAKVGSIYEWEIEEVLTYNHLEVRQIGIDSMNEKYWNPLYPERMKT